MYAVNGIWYVRYKDPKGVWRAMSSGTRDKATAEIFAANFSPDLKKSVKPATLGHMLELFIDPATNPALVDAQITGHKYGVSHAKEVSRNMRDLLALLKNNNAYWNKPIRKVSRYDCKQIMRMVHGKWGNTHKAHDTFAQFKMCMMIAAEEAWISDTPCAKMANIKAFRKTEVVPMTLGDIRTIISHPELFRFTTDCCNDTNRKWREGVPEMDYAAFVLMATTGMRRGEVGALTCDQVMTGIDDGVTFHYINVDKAYKDSWDEDGVGLPKWDFKRSIAISELTYKTLKPYLHAGNGRVFDGINKSRFKTMFDRVRQNAIMDGIEWEDPEAVEMLSPHKLRHALNTNLLCYPNASGESMDMLLISTYLSWSHQKSDDDLERVQRDHYTHINARRLIPIANCIDSWWNPDYAKESGKKRRITM